MKSFCIVRISCDLFKGFLCNGTAFFLFCNRLKQNTTYSHFTCLKYLTWVYLCEIILQYWLGKFYGVFLKRSDIVLANLDGSCAFMFPIAIWQRLKSSCDSIKTRDFLYFQERKYIPAICSFCSSHTCFPMDRSCLKKKKISRLLIYKYRIFHIITEIIILKLILIKDQFSFIYILLQINGYKKVCIPKLINKHAAILLPLSLKFTESCRNTNYDEKLNFQY